MRSKPPRAAVPGDRDRDGIPDPLDIDDDGDLILDNLDRSTAGGGARAAQAGGCGPAGIYCPDVSSGLVLFLGGSVNADAGSTVAEIDAAVRSHGVLSLDVQRGGSPELDCGDPDTGLVYCRRNGTGTGSAGAPGGAPFPGPPGGTYDADGDGFGALDPSLGGCCPNNFFLLHGARTDQIGSGDVLIEHLATGVSFPTTLQYAFASVPALVRYSDTAGHAATVAYPVPPPGPEGSSPGPAATGSRSRPAPTARSC